MNHYCATFLCLLLVALILPACQTLEAPVIPTDTGEGEGEGEGETDSTTSTDSSTADTDSHNGTDTGTNTGDDCGTDSADCDHNGVPDDKAWVHLVVQCTGCDNVSSVVLYGKNGDAFNGPPNYYHLYSNPPWPMDMILNR
ncbi:MAG: hypothetical protein MUC50_24510 [Myxococcota bacterium]|nr:hypothetical protein [Myxococcota bacterium]